MCDLNDFKNPAYTTINFYYYFKKLGLNMFLIPTDIDFDSSKNSI